jgi:ribonuclease HI
MGETPHLRSGRGMIQSKDSIIVFTDGACRGNPGPGGWAALLIYKQQRKVISGAQRDTTNNRMELFASIAALTQIKRSSNVVLYTDSQYVKNGITRWLLQWQRNGWRTANKQPIKNKDLWQQLNEQVQRHNVQWKWVRGHSGHPENDLVDQLARSAIGELIDS